MNKISIRFFKDYKVRAVWDEDHSKWWFSVLDIVGAINQQDDYEKNRNYWKYLKSKLKKGKSEVVSVTTQLKMLAPVDNKINYNIAKGLASQRTLYATLLTNNLKQICKKKTTNV